MKTFLRTTLFNSFSLFIIAQFVPGFMVNGGFAIFLFGGLCLTILFIVLRPILNVLALPLNIMTLGAFSFLVNVIIFYLLTVFVPDISITSFTFPGLSFAGFIIPPIYFNTLFSFILISFLQSLVVTFLTWLMKK